MRHLLYHALMAAGLLLAQCGYLNTPSFERIDDNRLRVIGVVTQPRAEAAPGDTVKVRAYFAGNPVTNVSSFKVSYDVRRNFSTDTFVNVRAVDPVSARGWLPDSMDFSFVIPDSVFLQGDPVTYVSREDAAWVYDLVRRYRTEGVSVLGELSPGDMEKLAAVIAGLVKPSYVFFTAESEDGSRLKVKSDILVRYNALFAGMPPFDAMFPVNNNPQIRWLGVYTVKGYLYGGFEPDDPSHEGAWTLSYLFNELSPDSVVDTIDIDTGYTYFIAADSGIIGVLDSLGNLVQDTSREWGVSSMGTPGQEEFYYNWFWQNLGDQADDPDSLLVIGSDGTSIAGFYPPLKTSMDRFRVWVTVHDELAGAVRPRGFAVRQAEGWLRYSPAYRARNPASN